MHLSQVVLSADARSDETVEALIEATRYAVDWQPSFTMQQSESSAQGTGSLAYSLARSRGSCAQAKAIEAMTKERCAASLVMRAMRSPLGQCIGPGPSRSRKRDGGPLRFDQLGEL